MIQRIALLGAESTGKTTLARLLADRYQTAWAPEYLRQFVDNKGTLPVEDDRSAIANGQIQNEDDAVSKANRLLFCDTDLIQIVVYFRFYFKQCPDGIERASHERQSPLYLLCDTDIPWQPDGLQRDGPEVRDAIQSQLRSELKHRQIDYSCLSGSIDQRLSAAIRVIDSRLII